MLIVLSLTRTLKCLEMNYFMPEKTVLLITAALELSQRLVIQNKLQTQPSICSPEIQWLEFRLLSSH